MLKGILVMFCLALTVVAVGAKEPLQTDTLPTSSGNLKITFIGHGSLMLTYGDRVIHVDPYSILADYAQLPKADLILVTHEHRDHLDGEAIRAVRKKDSRLIYTETCAGQLPGGEVMKNGDVAAFEGVGIEAVPAYNLVHKRDNGQPYHPRGVGNGYVLTFGNTRVYIAGDTENIPEMQELKEVDVAFLPMNLPYTMTPEMVAAAARSFRPAILYPYHFGETDTAQLVELLKDDRDIEVRLRPMK
ncbi:MBL fold metallo-hydrolase [Desulfuromonas sp. AOP6]|uniref:MBL fold metallo-hydrolase n=1 Tax=Desulfuromonas sp. AOP6 TaxID=1566351 RepID=UPI00126B3AE5|nr:MBL fold metallo-hydrolase [Desulfuromonas sp. AOP6]BCA79210.1 metal-dependent hydrolase [Desulfuromonas sp. AOP6]